MFLPIGAVPVVTRQSSREMDRADCSATHKSSSSAIGRESRGFAAAEGVEKQKEGQRVFGQAGYVLLARTKGEVKVENPEENRQHSIDPSPCRKIAQFMRLWSGLLQDGLPLSCTYIFLCWKYTRLSLGGKVHTY